MIIPKNRDDHPEEPLLLEELPDLERQVARLLDLPVVKHLAELLDGTVEEGPFRGREPPG
jgi:hypothetical protein